MLKEIRLISIGEAAQVTKVRKRELVRYGIDSSINLYIKVPDNVVPKLRSKEGRPDLFVNEIEFRAIPKYLRIKPEDCAPLCKEGKIERHVFPVAICVVGILGNAPEDFFFRGTFESLGASLTNPHLNRDIASESNEQEAMKSEEKNEKIHLLREIPHRTLMYDTELNDPMKFWETYHLGPFNRDNLVDIVVTFKDLLISKDDVNSILCPEDSSFLPDALRPSFARLNFKPNVPAHDVNLSQIQRKERTSNSHKLRHAKSRDRLKEIAIKVAGDNPAECQSYASWAACIYDLDGNYDLTKVSSRISQRSLENNLRRWFAIKQGKPVLIDPYELV